MLKGFYTGNGLPNKSIAARHVIRDYVNGILKYAKHPPGYKLEEQMIQQALESEVVDENPDREEHLTEINMIKNELEVEK